jgi:hypothetical protein
MKYMAEYHYWHNLTYLGKGDIIKSTGHPSRSSGGQLQSKIRPCVTHQKDGDLIWYGWCKECLDNYNSDNEWMFDYG